MVVYNAGIDLSSIGGSLVFVSSFEATDLRYLVITLHGSYFILCRGDGVVDDVEEEETEEDELGYFGFG